MLTNKTSDCLPTNENSNSFGVDYLPKEKCFTTKSNDLQGESMEDYVAISCSFWFELQKLE